MNKTNNCPDLESVKWTETGNLISLAILAFINVLVIGGNCLVIAAVFLSHKLRSVTNFFIVNLAVADLLVGLAVLPFSATWEVFKVWIFGDLWCRIWLAVDVWMCTASILNLCAISLDRFIAVTRPVTYPSIMSTARAKILVTAVWVVSFVICCPPLVGLITQPQSTSSNISEEDFIYYKENHTLISVTTPVPPFKCKWTCELTNHAGYVVYSAVGSFYVPMLIMLFFYYRIYRAAVRTTRAINQGFKTTRGSRQNRFDGKKMLTLRIHRGRRSNSVPQFSGGGIPLRNNAQTSSLERRQTRMLKEHERIKKTEVLTSKSPILHMMQITLNRKENMESFLCKNTNNSTGILSSTTTTTTTTTTTSTTTTTASSSTSSTTATATTLGTRNIPATAVVTTEFGSKPTITTSASRKGLGKGILKLQAKRFKMETKAAKTLAVIVGGFVCCWLPFFTMYLIRGFCHSCIQPLLFSILFWLGYFNSAINPLIYALFSKDFRSAFKSIIYKCLCKHAFYHSRHLDNSAEEYNLR